MDRFVSKQTNKIRAECIPAVKDGMIPYLSTDPRADRGSDRQGRAGQPGSDSDVTPNAVWVLVSGGSTATGTKAIKLLKL